MTITVYGASLSPYVRKVRIALAEKGLAYEQVQVDPFRPPADFATLSPFKRIPALRDGDKTMADSGVICTYLEAQYPDKPLTYSDPWLKSQVQWFEKFGDYELGPVATYGVFRNRVVMKLLGKPCDEEQVAKCMNQKLPPLLDYMESHLESRLQSGTAPVSFMVGDRFTLADIAIAAHFINLSLGGEQLDGSRWPRCHGWLQLVLGRPTVAPLVEQDHALAQKLLNRR